MALPPFLARLIGDRSSVAPNLVNDEVGLPDGRFPANLVSNARPGNPYRGDIAPGAFPEVPIGWHPMLPPRWRPGNLLPGISHISPKGRATRESVPPLTLTDLPRPIPGKQP